MLRKKILAGTMSLAMVLTMLPVGSIGTTTVSAAEGQSTEITLDKTWANPIGGGTDSDGNLIYGGDPSILVDGDTVYLYCGHDTSTSEGYYMPEWICYSTKDLKTWNYEGVIMTADKESITWANTGTDAWAGQIAKHKDPATGKDMYYFYYCTWDKNANDSQSTGKQSIGVAVSDSPTGGFKDIGEPLVSGTITTSETSGWNDIDPTVWIETDSEGVEHRYLNWGNGKNFTCELNEDMISVKDINGDGEITFGKQTNNATSQTADIIEMKVNTLLYTEAPWLYRRQDSDGNYYGDYYLFYAYGWREQMAYATLSAEDGLMDGTWTYGTDGKNGLLMEPAATSNTNHMAVFDFQGKTYFVYHNGSLPGGSGFRRVANIAEVHFNEDGSIQPIPETTIGIYGTTTTIYTSTKAVLTHDTFANSSDDSFYPYTDVAVTGKTDATSLDAQWAIVAGKADPANDSYVSIQSENKPGLYLTVNDDNSVTLAQDYDLKNLDATAKKQTFRTVAGLADSNGVSFESVSNPGYYLTIIGDNSLSLTNGSITSASTFYLNEAPATTPDETTLSSTNSLTNLSVVGFTVSSDAANKSYSTTISADSTSVKAVITLSDPKGYYTINGVVGTSGAETPIVTSSMNTTAAIKVYAENGTLTEEYSLNIEKQKPTLDPVDMSGNIIYSYSFDDTTGSAYAVDKVSANNPTKTTNPSYTYTTGVNGKAIYLDGSYGLDLGDASKLGNNYTISFWMNPDELHSGVDPIFTAGTFNPQYWLNMTFTRPMWSYSNGYVDDAGNVTYTAGKWQQVILTVNGTSGTLYIDGEVAAQGSVASGIMTCSGSRLYFGINGWDALFKGSVDDIVLLNRSITENEAKAIAYNYANVANNLKTKTDTPNTNGGTTTTTTTTKKANTITAKNISKTAKASKQTFSIGAKAATTLSYSSNNKKITVSKTGKVTIAKNYAGKATITIKAAANANYKAATKKITVTVKPAKVTKSSINATSKKKTITVKYKKAAGAVKYKVEVSTSKKFTKKTTKSVTVKKLTATIKKLKANKKYYVRVTAIGNNSVSTSAVTAKKTVKTKK